MTTIVANGAFDMPALDLFGSVDYLHQQLTTTSARYYDDADNYQLFTGTNLKYDVDGLPTGGQVTGAVTVENGAVIVQFSDFSITAVTLASLILTNNALGLWNAILAGDDTIQGSADKDSLLGNLGNDNIYAGAGNDLIKGEAGADILFGEGGIDKLYGGKGADRLDGGTRSDFLSGGAGDDNFVFSTALGATNIDTISDFVVADDSIILSQLIFPKAALIGPLPAGRFYTGAAAHDLTDRIIYDSDTGALYYDRDGTGAAAQVQFAQLSPGLALSELDFFIH